MRDEPAGQKKFIVTLLFLTLAGSALLFFPFAGSILFSLVLTIALYPPYERLRTLLPKRTHTFHATIAVVVLVVFVMIPLGILAWVAAIEAQEVQHQVQRWWDSFLALRQGRFTDTFAWLRPVRTWLVETFGLSGVQIQGWVAQLATSVARKTAQLSGALIKGVAGGAIGLFFFFFSSFFFFRDGPSYYRTVRSLVPLDAESSNALFDRLHKTIDAIIRGWGLTILVQGTAATIGFLIAGAQPAVLLGILAGLLGILPIGGTGIVWGPVGIILIASGHIWQGVFLFAWGACMVGLIDNMLAPFFISHRMNMSLLFLLVGILGGTAAMGIMGLFLGPLILSLTPTVFDIYRSKVLRSP